MEFAIAIIHAVEDPEKAANFLCGALGFQRQEQEYDSYLLNNGAISIRVVAEHEGRKRATLNLELHCEDLDASRNSLLAYPEVVSLDQPCWIDRYHMQTRVRASCDLLITLTRTFNEDELGILPPLPASLDWETDADACIREVLKQIPLSFRAKARIRVTEQAEMIAGYDGAVRVTLDHAVRALAEATPSFQHQSLCAALSGMGIDPGAYFEKSES